MANPMKLTYEHMRDLEEDLKILTIIPRDPDEPVDMVHDVVAPHALRRAIAAELQLSQAVEVLNEIKSIVDSIPKGGSKEGRSDYAARVSSDKVYRLRQLTSSASSLSQENVGK